MRDRRWIWIAIAVQFGGYVVDVLWHGLLSRGIEPATVRDMTRHLATVHLPLYIGAVGVLVATARALFRQRSTVSLWIAFGGAALSAGAEAWHAYSHLHLDTHTAPVAGMLSVVGFLVVVVAMALSGGWRWRRARNANYERRAA
jgi:hypothetical protein